jgi:hypothetical protein
MGSQLSQLKLCKFLSCKFGTHTSINPFTHMPCRRTASYKYQRCLVIKVPPKNKQYFPSNVNKPQYATMFGARFYCAIHYMFRPLISGHLQVICDKIYSKVATVYVNGSVELTRLRQVPWLCKSIQYITN